MASAVSTALGTAATQVQGVSGILMAVPQLAGAFGSKSQPSNTIGYQPASTNGVVISPPAIIFHYEGEQSVLLESDITDHPIEDNSYIQDQWARKPIVVTTHGFVGELTTALPQGSPLTALQIAANKLTLVGGVVPQLTIAAQEAYNNAVFAYNTALNAANSVVAAASSIAGNGGEAVFNGTNLQNANAFANGQGNIPALSTQGKQQLYFQQFLGYWNQRTLFTVQTPWAVFTNMAIMHVRPVQGEESNLVTDFEVRFKQLTFAQTGASLAAVNTNIVAATGTKNDYQSQLGVNIALGNLSPGPLFPTNPTLGVQ